MVSSVQNFYTPNMSCYMTNLLSKPSFSHYPVKLDNIQNTATNTDLFVKNTNSLDIAKNKFNQLFPNGKFEEIYSDINKHFGIDIPPKLNFVYDENSERGGGYTFQNNLINMNFYDLMYSNKKIVGIDKYGQKHVLVSPNEKLPLFVNEKSAQQFIDSANAKGSLGYTKLIVQDVTPDEQRKFIIQKVAHECIHAKQHQIIRETEGFSDKDIIKAWTHKKPKNLIENAILNYEVNKSYNDFWAKQPNAEKKYQKDSPTYNVALAYLNAIQNYPPVTSPEYTRNLLESEAYNLSYNYVNSFSF